MAEEIGPDSGTRKFTKRFEHFLVVTNDARVAAERDRDYVDHKQWTSEEIEALEKRGQAPVVINRIKTKVNLLAGIERQQRTDPKALPRTPKHEDDANSITDAIRFVQDNADFPQTSSEAFEDKIIFGYGAAITEVDPDTDEINVRRIESDRFYFDPHSRRLDFKDAKFMGIVVWLDRDDAKDMFPDKAEQIDQIVQQHSDTQGGETFEDRPIWVDEDRDRIRICQEYYFEKGRWMQVVYTEDVFLVEPRPSPYLDEAGNPENPIEADGAYIDRDNRRYGEVRAYIWAQDEINKRRSKFLHMISSRQTLGDKGVVEDVAAMKRELAKPDGHVELVGGPNRRFDILENFDLQQGHVLLYQDAKGDIDSIGANAALSGTAETEGMSGRALMALQQGGLAELGALFEGHNHWEKRIYRQIWHRIRQFWTGEKWVRVTDREQNLKWVGLNRPVTLGEQLQQAAQNGDMMAQQTLQQHINDPRLNQPVAIANNVSEIDVDIILDKSPDFATLRQEQFDSMAQLARSYGPEAVPFEVMLRLSEMPHKEEVIELLRPPEEVQADAQQAEAARQMAQLLAELEVEAKELENTEKRVKIQSEQAKAAKMAADADAQAIENEWFRQTGFRDAEKLVVSGD